MKSQDLRATWRQAILTFLFPIVLVICIRWLVIEPFVIPSGSMIPNLLIHDHIMVNKLAYGIKLPYLSKFLVMWEKPEVGDVVVFQYPPNPNVYFVKRLIGRPGDKVVVENNRIKVNGDLWPSQEQPYELNSEEFKYFLESPNTHLVRYSMYGPSKETFEITVPAAEYFMMGDNRDESADSRVWGTVPEGNIVGKVAFIWLSCDETLPTATMLCNPQTIRWNRIFTRTGL